MNYSYKHKKIETFFLFQKGNIILVNNLKYSNVNNTFTCFTNIRKKILKLDSSFYDKIVKTNSSSLNTLFNNNNDSDYNIFLFIFCDLSRNYYKILRYNSEHKYFILTDNNNQNTVTIKFKNIFCIHTNKSNYFGFK